MVFLEVIREEENTFLQNVFICFLASLIIAFFAGFSLPLFFTPVPLVLQSHVILFFGILLGPRRAASAVLTFLLFGAFGLPVFAGAVGNISRIFGVTGGYLIGYVLSAYIAGAIFERMKIKSTLTAFYAMAIGSIVLLISGMLVLSLWIGLYKAFILGVVPFLLGDILKIFLAVKALQWMKCIETQ